MLRILLACAVLAGGLVSVSSAMTGGEDPHPAPETATPSVSTVMGCHATAPAPGALTADYLRDFCAPRPASGVTRAPAG
ncbi:MAG: hypothetical protein JWR63_692 [Conexibacter sp.]|nr:hypothetical protein [Conexibacter sp.]